MATASGGSGYDELNGISGQDSVYGAAGDDTLAGGYGNDVVTGGVGQGHFRLEDGGGADQVSDFNMAVVDGNTADQLDVPALHTPDGSALKTFDVTVSDVGHDNAVLTFPGGETVVLSGVSPAPVATPGLLHAMGVQCFAEGGRIATPGGWRPVENLTVGYLVVASTGVAPVLWHGHGHGHRSLDALALAERPELRPVRLKAGHYGPSRDLILLPQHGVRIGRALIRARHMAECSTGAHVARGIRSVTYHHILMPQLGLLQAEGVWAESLFPGREALMALGRQDRLAMARSITGLSRFDIGALTRAYGPR